MYILTASAEWFTCLRFTLVLCWNLRQMFQVEIVNLLACIGSQWKTQKCICTMGH